MPHPDGPMTAVAACFGIDSETSRIAATEPKNADRFVATTAASTVPAGARSSRLAGAVAGTRILSVGDALTSINCSTEPGSGDDAGGHTDDQHDRDEYERSSPCLCMPLVVWAYGVGKDLERKRGGWLPE